MHVKELDSISLIRLCGEDKSNYTAWQEFLYRFSEKIKLFIVRSCDQARRGSPYLSSQISLLPTQEADDLTQQVFLRLLERNCLLLKRFKGKTETDLCAYLAIIAQSVVRNHYRTLRRRRRPQIEYSLDSLAETRIDRLPDELTVLSTDWEAEASFHKKEIVERLYAAVRVLYSSPEALDRAMLIFKLYFFQGLTADEISKCAGIGLSRPGVSKLVSTLRRDLRQYVKVDSY